MRGGASGGAGEVVPGDKHPHTAGLRTRGWISCSSKVCLGLGAPQGNCPMVAQGTEGTARPGSCVAGPQLPPVLGLLRVTIRGSVRWRRTVIVPPRVPRPPPALLLGRSGRGKGPGAGADAASPPRTLRHTPSQSRPGVRGVVHEPRGRDGRLCVGPKRAPLPDAAAPKAAAQRRRTASRGGRAVPGGVPPAPLRRREGRPRPRV